MQCTDSLLGQQRSREVALKIARTFRVTLDALPQGERQRILDVLDSLIRDAQAGITYAKPG